MIHLGSDMIVVHKMSKNASVHVDDIKGNSKSVLNQKMISVYVLKVS